MKDNNMLVLFIKFSYGTIIAMIISFLTTMITTRLFLPEQFGYASVFTSAMTLIAIFMSFGTDQALVRFFNDESHDGRYTLFRKVVQIPFYLTIVIAIIGLVFWRQASTFLFGIQSLNVIILLVFGANFEILYRYLIVFIRMKKRAHFYSLMQIIHKLLYLIILLLIFKIIDSQIEIIIATVLSLVFASIIVLFFEKRLFISKSVKLNTKEVDIFIYSLPFMVTMLITILFESIDRFFIRHYFGFYEVGLYSAAFKIVSLVVIFQGLISAFIVPIYFDRYKKNPEDRVFYVNVNQVVHVLMIIVGIGTIMVKDFLILLVDMQYNSAVNIIPFLVFYPVFYTISETTVIGINFMKKPMFHLIISILTLLVSLISNIILVPLLGPVGASIASALTFLLFYILRTAFSQKLFKFNLAIHRSILSILILIAYATLSVFYFDFYMNIIFGIVSIVIILVIYQKMIRELLFKIIRREFI